MANEDLARLRIDRNAPQGAPRRRRYGWWALLAVLAAAAAFWTFGRHAAVAVEVTTVSMAYPSQAYTLLNATGYVVAQRKAAVASKATGRLEWLNVREGSQVRAGEVLARLESGDVTAQMKQAAAGVGVARANLEQGEAELKDAARALERSRELLAKKFVSAAAHDAVLARHEKARAAISGFRAAIAAAEANLRAAQVAVEQTLIRAPFDGVVLTKNANVGDVITPFSSALGSQAAVVTMADMSTLEVEADVSEANLARVSVGQHCEIRLDALPGERFRGVVHRTVPTVDRAKATVMVKVRFVDADPRILPEMSAKVAFLEREVAPSERAPRTAVQPAAVVERGGGSVLFMVRDGRAVQVAVKKGAMIGELLEVDGVNAGDPVVLRPPERLRDGMAVAVTAK
ncbi:MAG: efflux RND transporter periplasmic adaptor subunit [Burkholderiales bacterium]|nr:efflux RND transporter periplasmic adaptor subunit [Burkholderiales bacterium]